MQAQAVRRWTGAPHLLLISTVLATPPRRQGARLSLFRLFGLRACLNPGIRQLAYLLPVRLGGCQAHSLTVHHDPRTCEDFLKARTRGTPRVGWADSPGT